jgi:DNA-binding IclR family transcriptional regulator
VSRPALSASRSLEIIELFTSFPERAFTFAEVIRATKINTASCHAILSVLTEKGYLLRSDANKIYQLGPSLIAAGRIAQQTLPIVTRAERAANLLLNELGLPVLLSTLVGDEILSVISLQDEAGHDAGMRGGERLPLIPPLGVPFLAWGPEEEIDKWMDRRPSPLPAEARQVLFHQLELTRQRGYHVHMRSSASGGIGTLIGEMSRTNSINDYREKLSKAIYSTESFLRQRDSFEPDQLYDPQLISAPIFDQSGKAVFTLGIGGFQRSIRGEELVKYAERLMRGCLEVMRGDRAQPLRAIA